MKKLFYAFILLIQPFYIYRLLMNLMYPGHKMSDVGQYWLSGVFIEVVFLSIISIFYILIKNVMRRIKMTSLLAILAFSMYCNGPGQHIEPSFGIAEKACFEKIWKCYSEFDSTSCINKHLEGKI